MFYQILSFAPRHGFGTDILRKEILVFYNYCFWKKYLQKRGIQSMYPSRNQIHRFFFENQQY